MFFFVPIVNFCNLRSYLFAYDLLGNAYDIQKSMRVYDHFSTFMSSVQNRSKTLFQTVHIKLTIVTYQWAVLSKLLMIPDSHVFPSFTLMIILHVGAFGINSFPRAVGLKTNIYNQLSLINLFLLLRKYFSILRTLAYVLGQKRIALVFFL